MSLEEELAQAALRGFFGDTEGFKDMQQGKRRAAVRAVSKVLQNNPSPNVAKKKDEGTMKFRTNSWHYKLWEESFKVGERPPETTDLCRYCHRVFWMVMWIAIFAFFALTILVGLAWIIFYAGLYQHTVGTLEVLAGVAVLIGGMWLYNRWLYGKQREPKTLVGQWVAARKSKVCPVVEFYDEDE